MLYHFSGGGSVIGRIAYFAIFTDYVELD